MIRGTWNTITLITPFFVVPFSVLFLFHPTGLIDIIIYSQCLHKCILSQCSLLHLRSIFGVLFLFMKHFLQNFINKSYWLFYFFTYFFVLFILLFYYFIFGCVGSSLWCAGFSLQWLLLLRALGVRASVVVACGLSNCGARAQLPCSMWDPPRPGLKPLSPALAGRFFTTVLPGKPYWLFY